ncbi:AIM24 family protein [Paracoccus sp. (in: a-proteobacteria)]|uniref:AIM24 family protein n=1 Tax=Paracoccus sp. TaxID=267 RepID=UPI002AFE84A1|nr:AIM24 family protein [Paracoccus sp. (in: a-proteobacteria)]
MIWPLALLVGFSAFLGATATRLWPAVCLLTALSLALLFAYFPNIYPFSAALLIAASMIAGHIGAFIVSDLSLLIREIPKLRLLRLAALSFLYTLPIIVVVWLSGNVRAVWERSVFYGCSSEGNDTSVYGMPVEVRVPGSQPDFYGRAEGGEYFVSGRVAETPSIMTSWRDTFPEFLTDPLNAIPELFGFGSPCPGPEAPADHEASAISTLDKYVELAEEHIVSRVDDVLGTLEEGASAGAQDVEALLFGDANHKCPRSSNASNGVRAVLPADGECIFGPLPGSCWVVRWIRHTGECIQRLVLKPTIRTYEVQRNGFHERYLDGGAGAVEAGRDTGDIIRAETRRFVSTELESLRSSTVLSIQRTFLFWKAISLFAFIVAATLIAKSFFHFLGRFVFSDEGGAAVLRVGNAMSHNSSPRKISPDQIHPKAEPRPDSMRREVISLPMDNNRWYVFDNAGVEWNDPGSSRYFFRLGDGLLQRMRAGKFIVHKAKAKNGECVATGRVRHSYRVMEVEIEKGQEIVVNLSRLLAFDNQIRIKAIFAPRLSAFLQYRLFFSVLYSPGQAGKFLLSGEGRLLDRVIYNSEFDLVNPQFVVAIDPAGSYRCSAPLSFPSPYGRPVTVGPCDEDSVLISDSPEKHEKATGWEMLRRAIWFVLPV